jgi:hypothetical protein
MTAFPSYSTGTVSVGAGATVIVGVGTIWSGVNARPGDDITIAGHTVKVVDVTDVTHLVIRAWPYTAVTAGTAYSVDQCSPQRFAGAQAMADVSRMIAALNTEGFYVFVAPTLTVPDFSLGDDGQYAFQATTGKLWIKTGGVWVFQGVYKAFGTPAPWNSVTAYNTFDVATLGGSSYVCILAHTNHTPPNATYWQLLASIGATGPNPLLPVAPWVTATSYVVGPPASFVSVLGSSYQCLVSHTSGTFTTDQAAGKWGLVAQVGATGAASVVSILPASTNFNSVVVTGPYETSDTLSTNAPIGGNYWYLEVLQSVNSAYTFQRASLLSGANGPTYWRAKAATTWGAWHQVVVGDNNLSEITNKATARGNIAAVLAGHLFGLTLSTAGATSNFTVAAGDAADSNNVDLMALASAITKGSGAWAVGSGNGGLDTGTITVASAWYHVHIIKRPDTGVVDVLFSLSATAPTLPTNYTLFRRIGPILFISGVWVKFAQVGDNFLWSVPFNDANATAVNTTAILILLSVPTGIKVSARYRGYFTATNQNILISSPDEADNAPQAVAGNNTYFSVIATGSTTVPFGEMVTSTDTSGRVRARATGAGTVTIATFGWTDTRGRLA